MLSTRSCLFEPQHLAKNFGIDLPYYALLSFGESHSFGSSVAASVPIGLSPMDTKVRELSILIGLLAREMDDFICAQQLCGRNTTGSVNFK